jgi:hypothetical protein
MIRPIAAELAHQADELRAEIQANKDTPLERELRTALALVYAALEELEQAERLEEPRPIIHVH